jgi:hypothetical protein
VSMSMCVRICVSVFLCVCLCERPCVCPCARVCVCACVCARVCLFCVPVYVRVSVSVCYNNGNFWEILCSAHPSGSKKKLRVTSFVTYDFCYSFFLFTSPVRAPDEVDCFNLPNPSSRTMALRSTQPLTKMSTRNLPGGKKRPARRADNFTAICEPIV